MQQLLAANLPFPLPQPSSRCCRSPSLDCRLSVATAVQLIIALKMGVHDLEVPSVLAAAAVTCLGVWVLFREHDTGGWAGGWQLVCVGGGGVGGAALTTGRAAAV